MFMTWMCKWDCSSDTSCVNNEVTSFMITAIGQSHESFENKQSMIWPYKIWDIDHTQQIFDGTNKFFVLPTLQIFHARRSYTLNNSTASLMHPSQRISSPRRTICRFLAQSKCAIYMLAALMIITLVTNICTWFFVIFTKYFAHSVMIKIRE